MVNTRECRRSTAAMSRRKQLNPRALHQEEDNEDEGNNPLASASTQNEQLELDENGQLEKIEEQHHNTHGNRTSPIDTECDLRHITKADNKNAEGNSAIPSTPSKNVGNNEDDPDNMGSDADEEEYADIEDDEYDDDDADEDIEENTYDSFDSDLYSTHTSSTYSPSLSEGAATPNSVGGINAESTQLNDDDIDENGGISKKLKKECGEHKNGGVHVGGGIRNGGDGSYHCQFCDKSFPRLGYLKKHEQSHAEQMPFKCDYCARLFKHKRSRDRHTKLHTGDRRYRCPHCEAAFSRSDHLKIHMKTHDNQKPFQCTVCNRGYNTAAALTSHMQNHKKKAGILGSGGVGNLVGHGPIMNYSPRSSSSSSSISSLQKRKYTPIEANGLMHPTCMYCTKSDFQSMDQLQSHIQVMHGAVLHENFSRLSLPSIPLSCEFCTMKFPSMQSLFHHLRTIHIDRMNNANSYVNYFNKFASYYSSSPLPGLSQDSMYDKRKRMSEELSPNHHHNPPPNIDVKPLQEDTKKSSPLPAAPKAVKLEEQDSPTDLTTKKDDSESPKIASPPIQSPTAITAAVPQQSTPQHQQQQQQPTAPGSFMCNQCNAALSDFDSFRLHLKSHLSQEMESFVCQYCGTAFTNQHDFESHVLLHFLITNSEHICPHNCNKSFAKSEDLQKHLLDMHTQTLYKCEICHEMFDTKVAMQVHFAVAHANEVKTYRCSACMEIFRNEKDFKYHIRTRHAIPGTIQCLFCRTVCASELEMHFHLAAHAKQYKCPACPESFHVEFLLDRHMQNHHTQKDNQHHYLSPKSTNNNNSTFDYHHMANNKNYFGFNKPPTFNPLKMNGPPNYEASLKPQHPHHLPVFREEQAPKPNNMLQGIYSTELALQAAKSGYFDQTNPAATTAPPVFDVTPKSVLQQQQQPELNASPSEKTRPINEMKRFGCGICEKQDFTSEADVNTHKKIVHNFKTGVSLRCAYCNSNFRSRNELENHMKASHNLSGKHKCLICDEIFPSQTVLAEHKLVHSKVGASGKCSHCSVQLPDNASFKAHIGEHNGSDFPVQCICCRQTLHSDYEIGLHAKFHTKLDYTSENACAMCLDALPPNVERKLCEKCLKKTAFSALSQSAGLDQRNVTSLQCNLCTKTCPTAARLQEHLIEHSFQGCEERGYICYVCSAVFTAPAALLAHMPEHGAALKPYDCHLCSLKFYFRSELDHHLVEHETGAARSGVHHEGVRPIASPNCNNNVQVASEKIVADITEEVVVKSEVNDDDQDDEYIEVEKLSELNQADSIKDEDHSK